MSNYNRSIIPYGNSFYINIELKQFSKDSGEYEYFDITTCHDVKVNLICAQHNTVIPLQWELLEGYNYILKCFVDYRLLHTTSYGVMVEGFNADNMHWRWTMLPKEGLLVVNNTSGMNIPDDVTTVDLAGRVGWGIQTDADLTNYYTKTEVNNLIENVEVDLDDLEDDIATQQLDISGIQTVVSGHQTAIQNQASEISGMQSDINGIQSVVSGHQTAIQNQASEISGMQSDINGIQSVVSGHQTEIQNQASEISGIQSVVSGHQTAIQNQASDITGIQSEISGIQSEISGIQSAVENLDTEKQDVLESGVNIKTVNGQSLLGEGNITISGGGGGTQVQSDWEETDTTSPAYIQNKPDIQSIEGSISDVQNDIDDLEDDIAAQQLEISGIQSNITGIQSVVSGHQTAIETQANEISGIQANITGIQSDINGIQTVVSGHQTEIQNQASEISGIQSAVENLDTEKQDVLESGVNIKTINGESIIGEGNITIEGGGDTVEPAKIVVTDEEVQDPDPDAVYIVQKPIELKTINGEELIGEGDIVIESGGDFNENTPYTIDLYAYETDTYYDDSTLNELVEYLRNGGRNLLVGDGSSIEKPVFYQQDAESQHLIFVIDSPTVVDSIHIAGYTEWYIDAECDNEWANVISVDLRQEYHVFDGYEYIQADWNETYTSSYSYIKNKPDISGMQTQLTGMQTVVSGHQTALESQATEITGMQTQISGHQTAIENQATEISGMQTVLAGHQTALENQSGGVTSVNGQTGAVTLSIPDPYIEDTNPMYQYFTITAITSGTLTCVPRSGLSFTLQYHRADSNQWTNWTISGYMGTSISLIQGCKYYFKGTTAKLSTTVYNTQFGGTAQIELSGNLLSLLYGDNFINKINSIMNDGIGQLRKIFSGHTGIISAKNLVIPVGVAQNRVFEQMFLNCTNLEYGPQLLFTNENDYTDSCKGMFAGCTSLKYLKCTLVTNSAPTAFSNWLQNVAATGTFIKADNMTQWTLDSASGIPAGWTVLNESDLEPSLKYETVTSNTNGLKIELVSALPASPDASTIYIVQ